MANSIPLSASSTLTSLAVAESLSVGAVENNTGKTGEAAPILISIEAVKTIDADAFAAQLPEIGGQGTEAQARLVVNAFAAALNELVATYGAITVNSPVGTIETYVSGTLASANDAIDAEVNQAFLGVKVPDAYAKQIAAIDTYLPASTCPATVKRVRDKATGAASIDGKNTFYLEGKGMTFGGTGEKLELLNAVTQAKVCDATVDTTTKTGIQFQCNLNPTTTVAKGTYILRLTTLGGGTETLWPLELKVVLSADAVKEG